MATEAKPAAYYAHPRLDLVGALPTPYGRVLDVGCGAGATGEALLQRGAVEVVGIELDPAAAEAARERGYRDVAVGDAEAAISQVAGPFDTVLCHDVLEHLPRPDRVLSATAEVATPNAVLSVSIPNARHISLLSDLIVHGTFGYQPEGHRDTTHLRWLTRKDLIALLHETGWRVTGLHWPQDSRRYRSLKFAPWLVREFASPGWRVHATPGTSWRPATSRTTKCRRKRA
jgi:2-polyprenyl-3-methyl-5-hydroxy-6-metoxy-1,4-benzoquinol methylase